MDPLIEWLIIIILGLLTALLLTAARLVEAITGPRLALTNGGQLMPWEADGLRRLALQINNTLGGNN